MSTTERQRSTIGVYGDTKERFDSAKPYDSMSGDEFVEVLLDKWEGKR
jgi:NAD dependent epimerase/dehydratase family enzyme